MRTVDEWKQALRAALRDAMRARQTHAVAVFRETLAAIDNAEAPGIATGPGATSEAIAGAVVGLGAGEVNRLVLAPADVAAIVEREQRERAEAAASYEALGRTDEAAVLRAQVDALNRVSRDPAP